MVCQTRHEPGDHFFSSRDAIKESICGRVVNEVADGGRHSRLLVVEQGRLPGVLALSDMLQYLSLKQELDRNMEDEQQSAEFVVDALVWPAMQTLYHVNIRATYRIERPRLMLAVLELALLMDGKGLTQRLSRGFAKFGRRV